MTASTSPVTLAEPLPLRCCSGPCDYRPEAIQHYLDLVLAFERNHEDPAKMGRAQQYDSEARGGTMGDGDAAIWDVQQAIAALRSERQEVNSTAIARRLCPWSMSG